MNVDVLGKAVSEYHFNGRDLPLRVWIGDKEDELLYPSVFFRSRREMTQLERTALLHCRGKILDAGAGAGCHSLILQENNPDVTALEFSKLMCEVMSKRGLKNVVCEDILEFQETGFDTILLLMNGFGIAGREESLETFLSHLRDRLKVGGSIIGESTDVLYMYEQADHSAALDLSKGYYGEVMFKLEWHDETAIFPWLFVDEFLLEEACNNVGMTFEMLQRGAKNNFLVKITKF